jgi:hypothetical protein
MNAMVAGTFMVVLTAAQCARGKESGSRPCDVLVVTDTVEAVASGDSVMVTAKKAPSDTVSKPYKTCVSLYAQAKDTVSKP